jgi:hypothetical protein
VGAKNHVEGFSTELKLSVSSLSRVRFVDLYDVIANFQVLNQAAESFATDQSQWMIGERFF